eukprot:13133157-Alexandrium_andersonii.AAC.1
MCETHLLAAQLLSICMRPAVRPAALSVDMRARITPARMGFLRGLPLERASQSRVTCARTWAASVQRASP